MLQTYIAELESKSLPVAIFGPSNAVLVGLSAKAIRIFSLVIGLIFSLAFVSVRFSYLEYKKMKL